MHLNQQNNSLLFLRLHLQHQTLLHSFLPSLPAPKELFLFNCASCFSRCFSIFSISYSLAFFAGSSSNIAFSASTRSLSSFISTTYPLQQPVVPVISCQASLPGNHPVAALQLYRYPVRRLFLYMPFFLRSVPEYEQNRHPH